MNNLISVNYRSRMRCFALVAALFLSVVSVPAQAILTGAFVDVEVTGRKQKIVNGQGLAVTLFDTSNPIISGTGAATFFSGYEVSTVPIIWLRVGATDKTPASTNIVLDGATLFFERDGVMRGTNDLTTTVGRKTRLLRFYTLKLLQP